MNFQKQMCWADGYQKQERIYHDRVAVVILGIPSFKSCKQSFFVYVTIQCNVVIPCFGRIRVLVASLSDVKCSVMLCRAIMGISWIVGCSLQGTVLNMFSSVFNVVKYNIW